MINSSKFSFLFHVPTSTQFTLVRLSIPHRTLLYFRLDMLLLFRLGFDFDLLALLVRNLGWMAMSMNELLEDG